MLEVKSEVEKARELNRLEEFVKAVLKDSWDLFDTKAHYDSSLTYQENKSQIRDKLRLFLNSEEGKDVKYKFEMERKQVEEFRKSQLVAYNETILTKGGDFYKPLKRAIKKVCSGYSNLAFIKGRPGIGKSFIIRQELERNKADFIEKAGDISEAALYRILCENNGKIIWFKELAKLLTGQRSLNILKVATESEPVRIISKTNYSRQQADLPDSIQFTGRLIFDYNVLAGVSKSITHDFDALKSRGEYVELSFSPEDVARTLISIAGEETWKKEVTRFIIDNYQYYGDTILDLRTQYKAFQTYQFCIAHSLDWKQELKEELEHNQSDARKMVYSLIGNKAMKVSELKRGLVKAKMYGSLETARRRVNEWIELGELFKVSEELIDYHVCLVPIHKMEMGGKYG